MAALTVTDLRPGGAVTTTVNTLTASDTITFTNAPQLRMIIENTTGSSVTLNLDGADAASFSVDGYGSLDPTSGLDVVVANNATVSLLLNSRSRYLAGLVTMTGATGATCIILQG